MTHSGRLSERALILAPSGRDAQVAAAILGEAGFIGEIYDGLAAIAAEIARGAGLAIIADEAIVHADLRPLTEMLAEQPAWSDFPIILMTRQDGGPERNPAAARFGELLGNITFLERPFHPTTLVSLVRTAVRSRKRQYEARATLTRLRESEQTLQTALTAGHLGSWLFDIEKRTLAASPACKALFGRSPDQAFSYEELLSSVHPADRARKERAIEASIATGKDYAIDYRTVWQDGSLHWLDVRGRAVKNSRGAIVQLIGVSSDITDRKNAESERERLLSELALRQKELSSLAATLEQRVEERTRQLRDSEAALRQAQKMELIGQLTGGVAHDFNNLLMAVMGNLDLLRKHFATDPRSARLIEGAMQGAQRGATLTQRMLAFARQQDLQTRALELGNLIGGIRDLLERTLGPRFELKLALAKNLPPAEVDGNQIEMAILNLVINARDAMPQGGVIEITADRPATVPDGLPRGEYVRLEIRDSGIGMSPDTLQKAVEPFFSTKEIGKGTGLGLSMVHGLAVQLGGLFQLASVEGQGTTATLWLPAATNSIPESVPVAPIKDRESRSATILVVDDDPLIAMATVDMLEDLGHTVLEAHSGQSALEVIASGQKIDAMMTDQAMPGMTGVELVALARKVRPDLPILLATGYADLPAGQISNLPRLIKPYIQDTLRTEIDKLLFAR